MGADLVVAAGVTESTSLNRVTEWAEAQCAVVRKRIAGEQMTRLRASGSSAGEASKTTTRHRQRHVDSSLVQTGEQDGAAGKEEQMGVKPDEWTWTVCEGSQASGDLEWEEASSKRMGARRARVGPEALAGCARRRGRGAGKDERRPVNKAVGL